MWAFGVISISERLTVLLRIRLLGGGRVASSHLGFWWIIVMALMSKGGGVGVVGRLDTDSARALPPGPVVPHMCDD